MYEEITTKFDARGKSLYKDYTEILRLFSNDRVVIDIDYIDDKINYVFKQRVLLPRTFQPMYYVSVFFCKLNFWSVSNTDAVYGIQEFTQIICL